MQISVFKVRFNREIVKTVKRGDVVSERGVTPVVRAKDAFTSTIKSWPEETKVYAVEKQDHILLALNEQLEEGQSIHIRQIDALLTGAEFFMHIDDEPEGQDKDKDKEAPKV